MKTINGLGKNINNELLLKVTKNGVPFYKRSNYVLVSNKSNSSIRGYGAIITTHGPLDYSSIPTIQINSSEELNAGDVVLIQPTGFMTVLYEIASSHNAIMATERCNHRCIMCPQPPIVKETDKTPFNLRLIKLFDKSTNEVGITGGEPTIIGDSLFTLIKSIKKNLPRAAISILSNGVKFSDKEYAKKLALCGHKDLQIDIPLFSDIAIEHNRIVGAPTFYKTVQGLYNLAIFKQRIGIRVVVHKQTYKRLPQIADFIYHNFPFVCQVAFMQMETIGLAKENLEQLWIDPYDYNNELKEAVLLLRDRGIPSYIYNAQLCVLDDCIKEFAVQSISDWKDIYLDECEGCKLKGQCAGFFASNRDHHSKHITPVLTENNSDLGHCNPIV